MNFKGVIKGITQAFNPNKKASGIMDVIVVEQPNGALKSTPFIIQFGISTLINTEGKIFDIIHRGQPTNISVILDSEGVGSFNRKDSFQATTPLTNEDTEKLNHSSEEPSSEKLMNNESLDSCRFAQEAKDLPDKNLTSDELKMLDLRPGLNVVEFKLRENSQVYMKAKIYLWSYRTKIVITDIDGTLTKSDIMGHICHMIGANWTRGGVVYFFNNLLNKGYKIVYLTARPISHLNSTRNYLQQIRQEQQNIPDGPLFLNPDGFMNALISELKKNSKIFKARILGNIMNLFPNYEKNNPFHSGIGNRLGDSIAYANVGIPKELIFIIDKKGKERGDHITIKNFKDPKLKIDQDFPKITFN